MVPPDAVEPLFKQMVNQFVHDRSRIEEVVFDGGKGEKGRTFSGGVFDLRSSRESDCLCKWCE
ncbi:hypothetical protein QJS04_geneDACA022145 [Acorus gramineus]|uniref:Uncharacterized protein n=1 Tax=Acorus gramineus TaxID=55184 RepID=A0AAV9BM28_ACOGR|nr:hypothetical protein QJS04_geneDACA022145 [Acorus gramineus]